MDLITISFQIATLTAFISHLLNHFEKYFPKVLVRTFKFGRAAVGLDSSVYFFEVPKRWFTHFYIFAFSFSTWTLFSYWRHTTFLQSFFGTLLNAQPCIPSTTALIASLLMWAQVSRRLYECIFISKFSKVAKMNILVYTIGHWHYFGTIVSLFGNTGDCTECSYFRIAIVLPIFVFAWVKQLEAHTILGNLRQGRELNTETKLSASDNEYKIPRGGLFEYVSCPNYFCEVLIYICLATLFGFQNSVVNWVNAWVILNQTYSAVISHNWYRNKFGDKYPNQRKALIPYIF